MSDAMTLIDRIYEAAVIPELWPDVCASLAEEVNGFSACILTADTGDPGIEVKPCLPVILKLVE